MPLSEWDADLSLIQSTLGGAFERAFGRTIPEGMKLRPGIWFAICGFPPVQAFLRQEKLSMAARLKVGRNKAGKIFQGLYGLDNGTLEKNVMTGIDEWLLRAPWDRLNPQTLLFFKKKVKRIAKKHWPYNVSKDGMYS